MESQDDSIANGEPAIREELDIQHPASTTIGTIVVQGGPLQLVIAVLQCGDFLHIKVADILPKLTFLGDNLNEALLLQRQHEDLIKQIQEMPSPIAEFYNKVQEKISSNARIDPNLVLDMAKNLEYIWQDIIRILQLRKIIINYNSNFFERLGECYGKMSALEVACNDTMIPMETEAVRDFIEKFKLLRTEMLSSVMATLTVGNQLLDQLRDIANQGTMDSRPDFIKQDALSSVRKVEQWLEDLHDKRNSLELAWQTRKTQLDQCLELTMINKDLLDVENALNQRRQTGLGDFTLGNNVEEVKNLLDDIRGLRQDAVSLRDKTLKLTKATEQLVSQNFFAGEEACKRAYGVLSQCTNFFDEIDRRENLLEQAKLFFERAELALEKLSKQEADIASLPLRPGSPNVIPTHIRMLDEVKEIVVDALTCGYQILDETGRNQPEVVGIERTIEAIENRNAHLENLCQLNSEKYIKISETLNGCLERYNELFLWLETQKTEKIIGGSMNNMGTNLHEARDCFNAHTHFLAELEEKGNEINNLLGNLKTIIEFLDDNQRHEVDTKIDSLRKNWSELKNFVLARVDVIDSYAKFHEQAENLVDAFKKLEIDIGNFKGIDTSSIEAEWNTIRVQFDGLKQAAEEFRNQLTKVADPYLQTEAAVSCVEKILSEFSNRQLELTTEWENCSLKNEIEVLLKEIIMANEETLSATSKIEAQLYPIFTTDRILPVELIDFLDNRIKSVETDIQFADDELSSRIQKLAKLESRDPETAAKIDQVRVNLDAIKTKLYKIRLDYRHLVKDSRTFLESVNQVRNDIQNYFEHKPAVEEIGIDQYAQQYEKFKYKTMEDVHVLLQKSEELITKFKEHEPQGAKEHDTDRIITLLEQLRSFFDQQADIENAKVRKLQTMEEFKRGADAIDDGMIELNGQLDKLDGNYGDSSASAKAISISFEYFERNIELLGKSLENLKNTSKNIIGTYPDMEGFVVSRANEIKNKWDELKERAKKVRKLIDMSIEYFDLLDQIETSYRRHSTYLVNMTTLANQINTPESGEHLARELEKYVTEHEQPQLSDLKRLGEMSQNIYNEDRTTPIYTDNINLFQSFHKLKADIDERVDKLKQFEAERMEAERRALEEKMRQAELEREYANLVDAVDAAYRRHNVYLGNAAVLADQINSPESGEHLMQEVAKYVEQNQQPQMVDIKKLADMSMKIYGEDRTPKIQLDNLTLFQALNNLREDIEDKIKNLQQIEAQRMEEEKKALEEKLKQAELEREYQNLLDQIEAAYKRHNTYFANTSGLAEQVNTAESGEHLAREIEKYIVENENPQFQNLNRLSQMSLNTFGDDKTQPIYKDNVTLFQSLHHLQAEVKNKVDHLRALEAQKAEQERLELEQKMKRAELEHAYQDLLDQIEAAYRRHSAYFSNASTLSENVNSPESGEHLSRELENYIRAHEQPQLDKLKALAQMSSEVYGEDLTEGIYLDNVGIFQALRKLYQDVGERIGFLREQEAREMDETRRALEEQMKQAELEREFANLVNSIEGARQRHQAYLNNVKSLIPQIKTPEAGDHLSQELQKYLNANEQPQIDNLKRLVEIAQRAYGDDRAGPIHTNNIELFQEFHKVKNDIDEKVKELRDADAQKLEEERRALEARMKEAEAERAKIDEQRRQAEEQRLALEEQRKREQAELALLEEQRKREELDRLTLEEQKLKEQAQHALLEQQRLKEMAERERLEEERKRKELEHVALEEQLRKEEAARFASYEPPSFVKPLADATIIEGNKFTFECFVKGFPEPNIQWYKDGVAIPKESDYKTNVESGKCTLTIEETLTADTAVFTCKASNSVGVSATAAKLFVRETSPEVVMTPPMFVKPLESSTATEGSSFQFKAVVTGNPLPQISWFKNDMCVDNSPDYIIKYVNGEATLKFEQVFLEDQALFKCRAVNSSGFEDSIAQLTVEPLEPTELPSFKVPLSNVMARVGQKIKLECEIVGIPTPEIYWLHNDKPIIRDIKLQYENERATLVINEAFLKDAGVYKVTAKNIAGEVSSACNVVVKGKLPHETSDSEAPSDMEPIKPSIQLPLKNLAVFEGKLVLLDCVIIGIPEPEVIWYHNDRPVKESQDVQLLFQGDRCSLIIKEAFLEDAGEYKVFAINNAGEATSQCTLSVTPLNLAEPAVRPQAAPEKVAGTPPSFQKLLIDVLCNEGDFIELDCNIQGEPVPEIKWLLNNKEIGESNRVHYVHQSDGTVKLKIENVRVEDKGVYTVKASNEAGEAKCFAHLNVKPIVNAVETQTDALQPEPQLIEPSFKELFADLTVPESETAKFECIVLGKPTPKVKWLFNDMPVAGREFLISTSGERQVLTIPKANRATSGKITCVAENELGRAVGIAYLNVGNVQPVTNVIDNSSHTSSHTSSIHKEYITTNTTKVIQNGNTTQDETHTKQLTHDQLVKQVDDAEPQVIESRLFKESHEGAIPPPAIKEAKDVQDSIIASSGQISTGKPARKNLPPRFVTPFVGKIVDQFADVIFEATVDGFPSPIIEVTKNGNPLDEALKHVKIMKEKNKVTVELKNVSINDAGRYSCNASNSAGSAGCTADLVVKKSIFPPVFCPRLSSQIVKIGDRFILECTITGAPEPTVTWFKDGKPIRDAGLSQHSLQAFLPNSYKLIIEHAQASDAGKYLVRATNAGGAAESIADVVVVEAQPQPIIQLPQIQVQQNQQQVADLDNNSKLQSTQTTQTVVKQFSSSATMAVGPQGVSFGTNTDSTQNVTGITQTLPTHGEPIATQTFAEPISCQTGESQTESLGENTISTQTMMHQQQQQMQQMSTQTLSQTASSMSTQTQEFIKVQHQTLLPDTPKLEQITRDYIVLPPLNAPPTTTIEPLKLQELSMNATKQVPPLQVQEITEISQTEEKINETKPIDVVQHTQTLTLHEHELITSNDEDEEFQDAIEIPESHTIEHNTIEQTNTLNVVTNENKIESQKPCANIINEPIIVTEKQEIDIVNNLNVSNNEEPPKPSELPSVQTTESSDSTSEKQSANLINEPLVVNETQEVEIVNNFNVSNIALQPLQSEVVSAQTTELTSEKVKTQTNTVNLQEPVLEPEPVLYEPAVVYQVPLPEMTAEESQLQVDISKAVEYGYVQKPEIPTTPVKGARLQNKIKALEEATRDKGDMPILGGIKVFPQMSVEEKRVESFKQEVKTETIKKQEAFVPQHDIGKPFVLEHQPQFVPQSYSDFNDGPKPYEGVPYMPESKPFEVNLENIKTVAPPQTETIKVSNFTLQRPNSQTPSVSAVSEVESDEHKMSTTEKRQLFEQRIREVSQQPCERQGFVQLYDPEELPEGQNATFKTLQAKREMFEQKIQEIQESTLPPLPQRADLTSPLPTRQQRPVSAADVGLEPGTPPELLFAPKFDGKQVEQTQQHQQEIASTSTITQTQESQQEYASQYNGFRRVEPPKPAPKPHPIIKPQPVAPSHFELPAEPEPSFKPIPAVPISAPIVPPKPAPKPAPPVSYQNTSHDQMRRYSESQLQQHQHISTHQKIIQHHHTESQSYHHQQQQQQSSRTVQMKQVPATPVKPQPINKVVKPIPINASSSKQPQQQYPSESQKQFQPLEPLPFKPDPPRPKNARVPPPPSPSKFIKGEFRESEYESDIDSRIQVKWHPQSRGESDLHYKPVRPVLTPTSHGGRSTLGRTPTPPTEFDRPPTIEGPPRPKFQPIERQQDIVVPHTQVLRPKPIQPRPVYTQSRSHDEGVRREVYSTEPMTKTYYTAIAGTPVHNAIATETSKTMHMKESTEKSQRTVNVTHTHRVIELENNRQSLRKSEKLEQLPYVPPPVSYVPKQRVPPPPTPTKFIPGEFRESDYDTDVDGVRIRPLWTPNPDNQDPYFRPVRAPQGRATSVPRHYERVMTPMEFDQGPIMPSKIDITSDRDYYNKTQTLDRHMVRKEKSSKSSKSSTRDDIGVTSKYTNYKTAAQQQINSMSSQFKDKAHQFIRDISTDQQHQHRQLQQQPKPIAKRSSSVQGERKPQFYRDENRVSEYGTKHIDPDTGLIYFKYDFGYEFGIIFPGEGRKIVGGYRNQVGSGNNVGQLKNQQQHHQGPPRNEITSSPSVRQAGDIEVPVLHERTPSSLAAENAKKRYSLPAHFNGEIPPPSAYVTPNQDAWKNHGRTTPSTVGVPGNVVNQEMPQAPKKPPLWITPLRDIAAVSGQVARFECIVQCEPHPDLIWTKNGQILQNDDRIFIEYRNGVCRLTIPQCYPIDAGQYSCTAANVIGNATTSAQLIIPTGRKGVR